jgi:hypothetical protein
MWQNPCVVFPNQKCFVEDAIPLRVGKTHGKKHYSCLGKLY